MKKAEPHWEMWWRWAAGQRAGLTFSPPYIGYSYIKPNGQEKSVQLVILVPDPRSEDRERTIQAYRFNMN